MMEKTTIVMRSLMQQLLTGKKRLVNPETGKAFEGAWERHSMSDLVFIDRKSLGKKTPDNFEFQYISLITTNPWLYWLQNWQHIKVIIFKVEFILLAF